MPIICVEVIFPNNYLIIEYFDSNEIQSFINFIKESLSDGAKVVVKIDSDLEFIFNKYNKKQMKMLVKLIKEIDGDYDEKVVNSYIY